MINKNIEFGMKKWRAYQSLEQSVKVTTTGSDCYNYGLLASGYIDIVAERLTSPHVMIIYHLSK